MKNILTIIMLLLLAQTSTGQNLKIGFKSGYGQYKLEGLKQFQSEAADYYSELNVEAVQEFPAHINYSASIEYALGKKNHIGINAGYYFTGGRNHVADYSGEYFMNIPIQAYSLGLQYSYVYSTFNKFDLYVRVKGGMLFSTVSVEESLTIYQIDSVSNNYSFTNNSYFCEPSAGVSFAFGRGFSIDFNLGYQFDFKNSLIYTENKDIKLTNFEDEEVYSDWSGLRIAFGLSFEMFKAKAMANQEL
jgi:hypothetical protein